MKLSEIRIEPTAAGAPAVIPSGVFEYHEDTKKFYKSDGVTKTEIVSGSGYTDEQAQDAVGAMVDSSIVYTDATPLLSRAALTGDVTASAGSNTTTIANDAVTFAKMQNITSDRLLGRDTSGSGDVEELAVGDGIEFSGSTGIVSSSRTLDRDASVNTFNTTTTETTIYSYTIPANTLGANDEIYTRILNYYLNNTGSAKGYVIKVKLGGTTVIDFDTTTFFGSNSAKRLVKVDIYISSLGATNSQYVTMQINHASGSTPSGSITTGEGSLWSNNIGNVQLGSGVLSQDMTSSKVFEVSIQLSTSSASHEWSSYSATTQLHSV